MTLSVAHTFVSLIPDDPVAAGLGEVLTQSHWNALHTLVGTIDVSQGGTGLLFGTSGGIPYFSSVSTMASSPMLPQNAIVLGGGAGGSPTTVPSLGTSAQVLHGNPSGPPSFAAINPATDFSGPIPGTAGGTGQTTYAKGDILVSPGPSTLNRLPVGTDGFILQADSSQTNGVRWAAGSGSATAGGSNTQVQFNNATVLAGSPNLTWVSPTLSIGVQSTTQGSLFLANTAVGAVGTTVRSSNVSSFGWTLTLPANPGSSNQLLVTDGSGTTSWVTRLAPAGSPNQIQYNNGGIFGAFTTGGDATINVATGVLTIANSAVTYAKIQNVSATSRFLGRITAGAGVVEELTGTQATSLLDVFTTALKGVVPASGGGTTNYLRADGTFAVPPGTASSPGGANTQVQFNSAGAFAGDAGFVYNSAADIATLAGAIVVPLVNGGVGAASTLTLQSTSGVGTTDAIIFNTGSQIERMRVNTAGSVTVNTTANTFLGVKSYLSIGHNASTEWAFRVGAFAANAGAPTLAISKTRHASDINGNGILGTTDVVGEILFSANDGATFQDAAQITAFINGTPAANVVPTGMRFRTNNSTNFVTDALVLTAKGDVLTAPLGALATNATSPFLYTPSCPGTPTGVPGTAGLYSGQVPIVIDTSASKLWGYIGGLWVNLTAGGGGGTPGGSSGQIQYNNVGSFGGFTMGGDATVVTSTGVLTIAAAAVTYAKIQNISAASLLLGRGSAAGAGVTQEITLGTNLTMAGTTLNATGGGGGTPGGASLTLQYNNGGSFGGMSGTSWDDTNRSLTMTGATVTTSNPVLNMTQTWNAGAVTFTGIKLNITNTASAIASPYLDISVGGVNKIAFLRENTFGGGAIKADMLSGNAGDLIIAQSIVKVWTGSPSSLTAFPFQFNCGSTPANFEMGSATQVCWSSSTASNGTADLFLTRAAAATLQFGAADVDTGPVAQTTQVQSAAAGGTSNVAGADWTFVGSKSKGNLAGGSIIFKTSPLGTSGTSQNVPIEVLKISPTSAAAGHVKATGQISVIGSSNNLVANAVDNSFAIDHPATSNTRLASIGGSGVFGQFQFTAYTNTFTGTSVSFSASTVDSNALFVIGTWGDALAPAVRAGGSNILQVRNGNDSAWSRLDALGFALQGDVLLSRSAAAVLQFGAADAATAVAQTTQVQSVVAGTAGNIAGQDWTFNASKGVGSGVGGNFIFQCAPASSGGGGTAQNISTQVFKISGGAAVGTASPSIQVGSGSGTSQGWVIGAFASATSGIWTTAAAASSSNFVIAVDAGTLFLNSPSTQIDLRFANNNFGRFSGTATNPQLLLGSVYDVALLRANPATLQFGYADAAVAVAQTIQVQSVVAGTTDTAGQPWTFNGSKSTGLGAGGNIVFATSPSAKATSTAQNTALARRTIVAKGKVLTSGVAFPLIDITLPTLTMAGGRLHTTILCTNGTDMQSYSQVVSWSAVNKGGTYTTNVTADTNSESKSVSAGTLTAAWTMVNGTNKVTITVTATTSLTPSTNAFMIYYQFESNDEQVETVL